MFSNLISILTYLIPTHSVMHCAARKGTYVAPVNVHIDTRSLIKIRTSLIKQYNRDLNTMAASLKFIGAVFDTINEELQPYGVQVESDLTKLVFKNKCISLPSSIATLPMNEVNLYILDCQGTNVDFHTEKHMCNINVGVSFGNMRTMTDTIRMELIKAFADSEYKNRNEFTATFNTNICRYANQCLVMENGLRSIRNLGSEEYVTGGGYAKRMHDMYDDVEEYQNGDPEVYATEDYSNEDELYADFKD